MKLVIRSPITADDWHKYFHLRHEVLRRPWGQPEGSEKDELEGVAHHLMAVLDEKVIGVCRIHNIDEVTAQIRFMAVNERFRGTGAGSALLYKAEAYARSVHCRRIVLQARENAVGFYKARGYRIVEKTFIMYNTLQHYLMEKTLS